MKLFKCGNGTSGNQVIDEGQAVDQREAARLFRRVYPRLKLDDNGYAKQDEDTSFCIAEAYQSIN